MQKSEDEVWKIINEVTKPRRKRNAHSDEREIAEIFKHFSERRLKKTQIKDPTKKLHEKVKKTRTYTLL